MGHVTSIAMLYRPLLALLNGVYAFIRKQYVKPIKLWPSVARELYFCRCFLPSACAQIRIPTETMDFTDDASTVDIGACAAKWAHSEVDET